MSDALPSTPPGAPPVGTGATSLCQSQALSAPPPDVQSLLDQESSPLAQYFDAQQVQACERAQNEWPSLWRLASVPE
jgi:hypothetical protein